jgi:hypothetical protein
MAQYSWSGPLLSADDRATGISVRWSTVERRWDVYDAGGGGYQLTNFARLRDAKDYAEKYHAAMAAEELREQRRGW